VREIILLAAPLRPLARIPAYLVNGVEGALVGQWLSRRRAYDAVGALEVSFQRTAAEPQRVRVPVDELAAFIDRAQRLMAHLSVIRLSLARRAAEAARRLTAAP
jgi:hypothetical protein